MFQTLISNYGLTKVSKEVTKISEIILCVSTPQVDMLISDYVSTIY